MLEYFITTYGTAILALVLAAIFGTLGYAAKRLAVTYLNDKTKQSIARAAAQFVEQAWKTIHGKEKLRKALEAAELLLRKKGIPFDAEEMEVLIEAAVAEFNEAFQKPLFQPDTADAVRRVEDEDFTNKTFTGFADL